MEDWEIKQLACETVSFLQLVKTPSQQDTTASVPEESVKFWELAGVSRHETLPGETAGEFLARINDPSQWLYGSALRDELLLRDNVTLPRFGYLARKAFIHYGGEHYNPHTISYEDELFMRCTIGNFIDYKLTGRVMYDWELIDNVLKQIVSNALRINLPYDQKRIDEGFKAEFRSPYDDLKTDRPN